MEKGARASKNVYDTTSSRFLDSFQGMFHPANADVPFLDRRALLDDSVGSDKHRTVRLLCDEFPLSVKNNSFHVGGQHRTHDPRKSPRALAYEGGNYGGRQDLKPSSPFSVYTKSTGFSSPAKITDFAGEIAAFESAAQAVSNKNNNFKIAVAKRQEKREESHDEPVEKRTKEDSSEDDEANNGTRETESYWERRRKNNASAKKSRDARKARELQTQMKAAFLEREHLRILAQLMLVQQENACLKRVLCAKT